VRELYGVEVSPELVSKVTDAVHDEVRDWQTRPLDSVYTVVYFDAVRVKIRDEGLVRNKAVYLAIGVSCSGHKDVLGLWIEQTEGAKFWLSVMNVLKARGVALQRPIAVCPRSVGCRYARQRTAVPSFAASVDPVPGGTRAAP
tara:strand:+ start:28311 stop:28739 length:429 start_codon:yes stop_codon:yes gene_type:complete